MASSSYKVKQGNILGRIGTGFGQGLADQIPKEVDRYRLSSGLKQFEQESGGLTPMQSLARLASIPGITPQMIQSFGELAKNQGIRNSYAQAANEGNELNSYQPGAASAAIREKEFLPNQGRKGQSITPSNAGQPQIVDRNPLRTEALPTPPWTPARVLQEKSKVAQQFPAFTPDQINAEVADREQRFRALSQAERDLDNYNNTVQDAVQNKFKNQIETKLQKTGENIYSDISGPNLVNLQRGLEKEIKENKDNKKVTVDDLVDKWTDKALNFARVKSNVKELASEPTWNKILKSDEKLRQLKTYQKIYEDANQLPEFFDLLRTDPKNQAGNPGFGFSPQVAAQIAYPRSKAAKDYIEGLKKFPGMGITQYSQKVAKDLFKNKIIGPNESILAIAQDLSDRLKVFSPSDFYNYISENQDDLPLSGRQRDELGIGRGDYFPNWADIWIKLGGQK